MTGVQTCALPIYYIEGLFLSSGVLRSPDYTMELMIRALRILREEYRFNGYIHAKAIPGAAPELVRQLGLLADRLSVNIELPSQQGLQTLAPDKSREAILRPMGLIRDGTAQSKAELAKYRHAPVFAPAGQSTQLIVGATDDSDRHILHLTESLYRKFRLKRVFYSAYVPVVETVCCRPWTQSRLCCGSTVSIRRTGSCGFMAFRHRSCWMRRTRTLTRGWIPSAAGRWHIWSSFR